MTRWSLFLQTLSLLHHFLGLYSGETDYRAPRRSPAELAAAIHRRNRQNGGDQELNERYKRVADLLSQQAQERKAAQGKRPRRGRSSSSAREKERGYKLPQIVVVQEPLNSRRMGGL